MNKLEVGDVVKCVDPVNPARLNALAVIKELAPGHDNRGPRVRVCWFADRQNSMALFEWRFEKVKEP